MKRLIGCLFMAACLFSCADLDLLRSEIDALSEKLQKIEQNCEKFNNDLLALSKAVEALQNEDAVTSVTPVVLPDGTVEAYIINFRHSGLVTIYNGKAGDKGDQGEPGKDGQDGQDGKPGAPGKDGKDAAAPVISIRKDVDGKYYWTADGEWVVDENASKVEVDRGGVIPSMKVEDNRWHISYDGGESWVYLADYEPGMEGYVFSAVDDSDPDFVRLTLADGSVLDFPRYKAAKVSLSCDAVASVGGTVILYYSVADAASVTVQVDDSSVQSTSVSAADALTGTISVNLRSNVSLTKQRLFVIFKVDGGSDDWWLVTFDSAGKVLVSDIQ
jgi:hypothetical protein